MVRTDPAVVDAAPRIHLPAAQVQDRGHRRDERSLGLGGARYWAAPGAGPKRRDGFEVLVGGGLGRTPFIGKRIREWLPQQELLAYLEAILRVYNRYGRRDNIHRARIKVLVKSLGIEEFSRQVEAEFAANRAVAPHADAATIARLRASFAPPPYLSLPDTDASAGAAAGLRRLVPA